MHGVYVVAFHPHDSGVIPSRPGVKSEDNLEK